MASGRVNPSPKPRVVEGTVTNEEIAAIPEKEFEETPLFNGTMADHKVYTLLLPPPGTEQAGRALEILQTAMEGFIEKNKGYGEPTPDDLGAMGQFADMHRKWKLIRRHLWDGEEWKHHESFEQVCMELIGHLLLTVDFYNRRVMK